MQFYHFYICLPFLKTFYVTFWVFFAHFLRKILESIVLTAQEKPVLEYMLKSPGFTWNYLTLTKYA